MSGDAYAALPLRAARARARGTQPEPAQLTRPSVLSARLCAPPPPARSPKNAFLSDLASKIGAGPPKKPAGLVKKPEVSAADAAAAEEAVVHAASDEAAEARAKMAAMMAGAAKAAPGKPE